MEFSFVERLLSGNAVLVTGTPIEFKHGWCYPCFVHENAYKNGAIRNARKSLQENGIRLSSFEYADQGDGWGKYNVYIFES